MKRRNFLVLLAASALDLPATLHARPQRRIGVLVQYGDSDVTGKSWLRAFREKLSELGWAAGRDVSIDERFTAGNTEAMRRFANDLAALQPDVVLVAGTGVVGASRDALKSLPVVFVQVTDPVGTGFVQSLAHPGGNMTGFTSFEYSFGGKWLELLKEAKPSLARCAVIENPDNANHTKYLKSVQKTAAALGVQVIAADVRNDDEIARRFSAFGQDPNVGVIVPPDPFTLSHRSAIVGLANKYRLPAIYAFPPFVRGGGLMSYGIDNKDMYVRAASYVNRILRGEKPADLPVQASSKFQLLVNLKTMKSIGLDLPPTLLARADEVIE